MYAYACGPARMLLSSTLSGLPTPGRSRKDARNHRSSRKAIARTRGHPYVDAKASKTSSGEYQSVMYYQTPPTDPIARQPKIQAHTCVQVYSCTSKRGKDLSLSSKPCVVPNTSIKNICPQVNTFTQLPTYLPSQHIL